MTVTSLITDDPGLRHPHLTPAERQQILVEWNQTRTDYPRDKCIQELFEAQAVDNPRSRALVFEGQPLTYAELNVRANQLAHHLQSLGVGAETLVGVCVERSIEMVVGLLGVLKAGGAYVPLDPSYPQERVTFMAEDAQLSVILTQERLRPRLPDSRAALVCLDRDWRQIAGCSAHNPPCPVTPEHLAYVMYTSGSTGTPKGVSVVHRGIVRLVRGTTFARLASDEVFLQYCPISFDVATFELWGSLLNGGVLVVPPPGTLSLAELGTLVRDHGVTTLWLTAGLFHLMVDERLEELRSVRQLLAGGDVLSVSHVKRALAALKGCTLINGYGPTENTTFTCCYSMTSVDQVGATVSIGRPIANTTVYILDRHLQPVPVGVPGELYTGGDGVAREYYKRPELTRERFIQNPFGDGRLYRTGDLARYQPDGNIEFLGRIDHQVKVRGFRIELGEIETVLEQHPSVRQAVVLAVADHAGEKQLRAYLTVNPEAAGTHAHKEDAREHVDLWRAVYDETYSQTRSADDPTFHVAGWTSSYTGQPIPADQMREWVDHAVACIQALGPQRVLEIGCGTGMLLARVAPHCTAYVGIDFSRTALDHIRGMQQHLAGLDHVRLLERSADDLADLEAHGFDTIILNSVTQHFPDVDYLLRVLRGAVRLVKPGGHIFVGDVCNLALLEVLHTSVQLYRAADDLTCEALQQRIGWQMARERDLRLDPQFFLALQEQLPEVTHVQVWPKRGRYDNELSRFRYEVVLHIGEGPSGAQDNALRHELAWLDWHHDRLQPTDIRRILIAQRPPTLAIRNIANARVARDVAAMHELRQAAANTTVAQLRALLAAQPASGLHPEELWAFAQELPYHVELNSLNSGARDVYDVVFTHDSLPYRPAVFARRERHSSPARYASQPRRTAAHGALIRHVRELLEQKLPEYMVPATFTVLEKLPLSPNGKVDRRTLAQSNLEKSPEEAGFTHAHNPVERMLAELWADVLNVKQVGRQDDFFALGGNSLKAMAVVNRLQRRLNRSFRPLALFHAPTVARFAVYLREQCPDLPAQLAAVTTESDWEEGEI